MKLDGIHHITCITADAPGNVDFYARLLGLRLVKKTGNVDAPDVYHLYYGDERGAPGSILTFFEFPDAARGRAGAGMIHRLRWRGASEQALEFWSDRLGGEGVRIDSSEKHALQGFEGVRVYGTARERENRLLTEALGFTLAAPGEYSIEGGRRRATYG